MDGSLIIIILYSLFIQYLIENGADINKKGGIFTALDLGILSLDMNERDKTGSFLISDNDENYYPKDIGTDVMINRLFKVCKYLDITLAWLCTNRRKFKHFTSYHIQC